MKASEVKPKDYRFCISCNMFFDFWKYDYNLENAGHDECVIKDIDLEEFEELKQDCIKSECFDEE